MDMSFQPSASSCQRTDLLPRAATAREMSEGRARKQAQPPLGGGAGLLFVALAEALHAAGRVDQLLLAGEKRVAVAADLEPQLFLGGVCLPRRAAGAVDQDLVVFGVQILFHGTAHCRPARPRRATPARPPYVLRSPRRAVRHCQ